jgi:hypothetical protein
MSAGADTGSFIIRDNNGTVLYNNVTKESIMSVNGLTLEIPYETTSLTVESTGVCETSKTLTLTTVPPLITRYYELVACDPQYPNAYTKLENTLPANQYVKPGMTNIFYVYQGAYVDQNFDPSNLDTSIVPTSGVGCP